MAIKTMANGSLIKHEFITGTLEELDKIANARIEEGYVLQAVSIRSVDVYNGIVAIFYVWAKVTK